MLYDESKFDSCTAKGICSIGPRTSSLQEILLSLLSQLSFYALELKSFGGENTDIEKVVFNSMSAFMTSVEYDGEQFADILRGLSSLVEESKRAYSNYCKTNGIEEKQIFITDTNTDVNLSELINQGEKEYSKRTEKISFENKNLFDIVLYVLKSLCVNLSQLRDYNYDKATFSKGFGKILSLFNLLNYPETESQKILDEIESAVLVENEVIQSILKAKVELFGNPHCKEVSLSTRPNKAILVSGSNFAELERVLEYTKDKSVDVYTHGEMIFAHSYSKFHHYPHLVGHFKSGADNYLSDFANFPGAIFIQKYTTENIEYLYRGRLFTTDFYRPKGVVRIEDNDFAPLVESALQAKGFKHGKSKSTIYVGMSFSDIDAKLEKFFTNADKYRSVILIAPEYSVPKNKKYFETMINNIPSDTFVISYSYKRDCENLAKLNAVSEFSSVYYVMEKLKNLGKNISVFLLNYNIHTVSNIINFNKVYGANLFLVKDSPIRINPTLIPILKDNFGLKEISNPLDDIKY